MAYLYVDQCCNKAVEDSYVCARLFSDLQFKILLAGLLGHDTVLG